MFTRILFISIMALSLSSSFAHAGILESLKFWKPKPSSISIEKINEGTVDTKDHMVKLSKKYVIKQIEKNNKYVAKMKKEVSPDFWEQADADEKFDALYKEVKHMNKFYGKLADKWPDVESEMQDDMEQIESFMEDQETALKQDAKWLKKLEKDLSLLSSQYSGKELEVRKRSLQERIRITKSRIRMISDFQKDYKKIYPFFVKIKGEMDLWGVIVTENASVYEETYNTLTVAKDIRHAYDTLLSFKSYDHIITDLMDSWTNLEEMLQVLTDDLSKMDELESGPRQPLK